MSKDLFQTGNQKDIYLTMDLWAMLSPRLAQKKHEQSPGKDILKNEEESHKEKRNIDVDQCC